MGGGSGWACICMDIKYEGGGRGWTCICMDIKYEGGAGHVFVWT